MFPGICMCNLSTGKQDTQVGADLGISREVRGKQVDRGVAHPAER